MLVVLSYSLCSRRGDSWVLYSAGSVWLRFSFSCFLPIRKQLRHPAHPPSRATWKLLRSSARSSRTNESFAFGFPLDITMQSMHKRPTLFCTCSMGHGFLTAARHRAHRASG